MAATSVTGKGSGNSRKPTANQLAALSNGPVILVAGRTEVESMMSPPSAGNYVRFSNPLPGDADNYVVMLTPMNGTSAYISAMLESDGNFTGFVAGADDDCTVMYMVCKAGHKPNV